MTILRIALFAAAIAAAAPVLAHDDMATATPDAKPMKIKKTCRSEEVTGSNIPSRTCHTPDEWASIDNAEKQNHNANYLIRNEIDQQQRSSLAPPPGGGQ